MKRRFLALVLAGCLAAVLSTAAWAMSPTGFYLNVELPSGETIALDAESGDSIDNIKGKLETKTKIAAGEQHLYYGGNLLVDGRTLANYNIQKGSTLLLTTKIKGTPAGEKLTEENMSGSTIGAPVTISEKTLNSGTYYLCNNVKLTQALVIQGDVTLDLNGFVLQHENRDANDSVIQMDSGTLTLVDSNPDAIHKFVKEATGLWTLNENAGTEIVKGGVITGGIGREHSFSSVYGSISENGGGGVFINQDASFVMEGGNIVGCSAVGEHNTAGGVLVARSASFVMKAGKIAGCTAARGGGVYVADRDGDYALGSFTMNGGTIEWCVAYGSAAYDDGGGVNNLGSFTMNGGTIRSAHNSPKRKPLFNVSKIAIPRILGTSSTLLAMEFISASEKISGIFCRYFGSFAPCAGLLQLNVVSAYFKTPFNNVPISFNVFCDSSLSICFCCKKDVNAFVDN